MSKNFELMQESLKEALGETSVVPEPGKVVLVGSEADRDTGNSSDFDAVAQQECFKLVQRVFLGQPQKLSRTVVFAGVDRGNGCSRICVEVARILAASISSSVCLVDANFRTPSLPGFFGVPGERGLADAVLGEGEIRSFAQRLKPSNLWLLSAGNPVAESTTLLSSDRLKLRLQELRMEFDFVLIDVPALNLY